MKEFENLLSSIQETKASKSKHPGDSRQQEYFDADLDEFVTCAQAF
jgi:hypothetical protein